MAFGVMKSCVALLPLVPMAAAPGGQAAPAADYAERAAKLEGKKDAEAWLKLADFAEERLLWTEREQALRKAVAADPGNAEAHARLDEVKVGKDWLPAGEAEALEAAEQQAKGLMWYGKGWIPAAEADRLREADRKAVGWDVESRLDTPHLTLYSARPLAFTRHLAALLEDEVGVYRRLYGKVFTLDPKPFAIRVYVFADRDTFARIVTRDTGHPPPDATSRGIYHAGILYVGAAAAGGDEEEVLKTAAHEMTHALDGRVGHVLRTGRLWLVEGRADYLGFSVHGRRILPGRVRIPAGDRRLEALSHAIDGVDLREVMTPDAAAFMANAGRNYTVAWAWVHFLFHAEGGRYAPAFRDFLRGLPDKADTERFEGVVGKLSDLEPAFRRYVREALVPMGEKAQAMP